MADIIEFNGKKRRPIGLESGEILSEKLDGLYEVLMDDGPIWMKKADGCLLKPEIGDEVMVAILKNKVAILSVLTAKNKAHVLDLGQRALIKAERLNIQAQNYTLSSYYATEVIQAEKIVKAKLLVQDVETIQITTDQFAVN